MAKAKLIQDGLETRLEHKGNTEILEVSEYPENSEAVFAQFSAMHLLAPHMPKEVVSNFPISGPMKTLIGKMYEWEGKTLPKIISPSDDFKKSTKTSQKKAVVSYSAGKDSMWNLWRAQEEYGKDNVLAVHIYGLNTSNSSEERKYSERQSKEIGFKLEMLKLRNSSGGEGYNVMVSRDMFMTGIMIPYAHRFGARYIITEGFGEADPREPFTGDERNMIMFNQALADMGMSVEIAWNNKPEMDIVKDLYENIPDWMPHVCNCFSPNYAKPGIRRSWEKRAPSFELYDSQCGSCVKCQIVNIGRINYDSSFDATDEDIITYLQNTEKWLVSHGVSHKDMITPSFVRDYRTAAENYGVKLTKF